MRNKKILFCLTFAGGTATFYERLIQRIQPDVEVICFDYSGHGKRYKEKLPSDFEEVANDFYLEIYTKYREIIEEENTIYALMGYSMGSI